MQSEPGGSVVGAFARRRDRRPAGGQRRHRRGRRRRGVLPLQQPRVRAARRGRRADTGRLVVGRRHRRAARTARHDPDDVPTRRRRTPGATASATSPAAHPRAAPGHRRDGAGRPGLEHGRPTCCGGPSSWPPATPTCSPATTLDEMAALPPPADGYGLGLRLMESTDGACAGTPVRCRASWPACSSTRRHVTAASLLANATPGIGTEWVPRMLLGDDAPDPVEPWAPVDGAARRRSSACRGCGSGATPPSSCAGTTTGCGSTARRPRRRLRLRGCAATGSSAIEGYHRGEVLHVVRRDDGSVQPPRVRDVRVHPGALRPRRRHPRRPPLTASRRRSP